MAVIPVAFETFGSGGADANRFQQNLTQNVSEIQENNLWKLENSLSRYAAMGPGMRRTVNRMKSCIYNRHKIGQHLEKLIYAML